MIRLNFLPLWLVFMISLVLSGCGENINQYKERVQQDNDRRNPTANKAVCLAVGNVSQAMYPYTIKYIEGNSDNLDEARKIYANNKLNLRLSLYAKAGLFTEELVGEDNGKPLYRYQFTDEGNKYVSWWGGANFCFGRVVVDNITGVYKLDSGSKIISYMMHYENIPDWLKIPEIYNQYDQIGGEAAVTGKQVLGSSMYYLDYDGKLGKNKTSMSGGYIL